MVSAVILTPMDDCLQAYTMFDGPGCTGNSKVSQVSYDTADKLQTAITAFNENEDGTKVVMSVSHYRGSSIEIFALEGMDDSAGSVTSDYPGQFDGSTLEKVCTTFQFYPTGEPKRSMPQLSLKYVASHCPADEAEVQQYVVP